MSRFAYVNGRYVPHRRASVHIEDRGYQFGDGVYEVVLVANGRLIDLDPHLDRLDRSLAEVRIPRPMSRAALSHVLREVVRRNRVRDGMLYFQVTRGVAPRDHYFPAEARPSLVVTAKTVTSKDALARQGVAVVTMPDNRWGRCDIKSVALIANVLAKQAAREAGAFDAWLVGRDGLVTESAAANAWIVTADDEIRTRHTGSEILSGITRRAVMNLAEAEGLRFVEKPFSVAEAKAAREAFMTSSTALVMPVVKIDDVQLGDGAPGPIATKLREVYVKAAREAGGAA